MWDSIVDSQVGQSAGTYLPQTAWVLLGVFGVSLLLLLVIGRFSFSRVREGVLFKRWVVWACIAPVYAGAVIVGTPGVVLLVAVISFQAAIEYSRLVSLTKPYRVALVATSLFAAPAAAVSDEAFFVLPVLLLIAGTFMTLSIGVGREGIRDLAYSALGWAYVALLPAHMVLVSRDIEGGTGVLLIVGFAVALSDIGAFVIGKAFGRRKLAPKISPGKTVAGVFGNVFGAAAGVGLFWFAVPASMHWAVVVTAPLVIACGAVWGDLFESVLKREFAVKDAGTWLPGFGGLLDRVDSLLIVAPLIYYGLVLSDRVGSSG